MPFFGNLLATEAPPVISDEQRDEVGVLLSQGDLVAIAYMLRTGNTETVIRAIEEQAKVQKHLGLLAIIDKGYRTFVARFHVLLTMPDDSAQN